ncbi:unnamed protein product, partial [Prorocentrum cordatum]
APGRSRGRGAPMSHHGTVKSWVGDKGFGFLLPDGGGEDVFVHRSALIGAEELLPGDKVIFDIRDAHAARISAGRGQLIDAAPPWFKAVNVSESLSPPASGCFGGLFEDAPGRPAPAGDVGAAIAAFLEAAAAGGGVCGEGAGELLERFVFAARLLGLAAGYAACCEARGATVLADFEGEMPGHGGVLTTAQVQVTRAMDGLTLAPAHAADGTRGHWELGLLVHLEGEGRIGLLRRIMESARIVKVMWGVRGDCESLLYQHWPVQLAVTPEAIVDAKAAFLGLGMGKMLAHVPPEHLEGLPQKEQIDFDSAHAANREALPLPLGLTAARYAVDDLHRIEAILLHKLPRSGSYAEARSATDSLLAALRGDPCGLESLPRRATATPGRCWAAPSGSPTPRCAPRASPCRQTSPSPGAAERRRDSRTSSAL